MFGKMIANTMIKPFQSLLFDDPKRYGLDYEDVTFFNRIAAYDRIGENPEPILGWFEKCV
jgi:hypothetical protein